METKLARIADKSGNEKRPIFTSLYHLINEELLNLFKVLKRRSNRRSYNWEGFTEMLRYYKLPYPKIYESLFD